jgi:hypothetical protein
MARTGRPRLSSAQMQENKTRADRVRQRVAEEAKQTKLVLLHSESTAPEPPADLIDDEARTLFLTIHLEFSVTHILERVVSQCCYALQRCNQMRRAIDAHADIADVPRHLLSGERDARQQYTTILDKLGAFREEK